MTYHKRLISLLCIALSLLAGCGRGIEQIPVSVYELQKTMIVADTTLPEMLAANSSEEKARENFEYLSDLDYGKVEGYFLAYSATGLADEIAVIVLKDMADTPEAVKSLQKHVQGRVDMYKFYEPDQAKRAENAVIFSRGRCAVLIISDKPEAARGAFEKAVIGGQKR